MCSIGELAAKLLLRIFKVSMILIRQSHLSDNITRWWYTPYRPTDYHPSVQDLFCYIISPHLIPFSVILGTSCSVKAMFGTHTRILRQNMNAMSSVIFSRCQSHIVNQAHLYMENRKWVFHSVYFRHSLTSVLQQTQHISGLHDLLNPDSKAV